MKEQLIAELTNYIENGYLDINSFGNPPDEAATALRELHYIDGAACEAFCRIIILSSNVGDVYLDSLCLSHLFNLNKNYALEYVVSQAENMPSSVLGAAMDGLFQYSNTPFRAAFSEALITQLYARYDEVAQDPYVKERLASAFDFFSVAYPRKKHV